MSGNDFDIMSDSCSRSEKGELAPTGKNDSSYNKIVHSDSTVVSWVSAHGRLKNNSHFGLHVCLHMK